MSEGEVFVQLILIVLSALFFYKWYLPIVSVWPRRRGAIGKLVLCALPAAAFAIIRETLVSLASFDVVGSGIYIFFYLTLGFAWLFVGQAVMTRCFDISRLDDILGANNKSALIAFSGGFLGMTVIYAAANIGDGPGWWCVVFAGGLGLIVWVLLAMLLGILTGVFERVTVGRDIGCGIRFGCYLLASGIILGRASAGDWTSFGMTVVEFSAGWPVLPLVVAAAVIERAYNHDAEVGLSVVTDVRVGSGVLVSLFFGLVFIAFAVVSVTVILPPMNENLIYPLVAWAL